jgi:glutamate racemase
MLAYGVDTLVLGCTHYPFIRPLLEKIVGSSVHIIDPAPAVARQTQRRLQQAHLLAPAAQTDTIRFVTSANAQRFSKQLQQLLGLDTAVATAVWQNEQLLYSSPKTGN